ncbi:MAG: TrbG/VirB9 family P-type conjugative transfer protein, partial [Pseudomonadota bacterium]
SRQPNQLFPKFRRIRVPRSRHEKHSPSSSEKCPSNWGNSTFTYFQLERNAPVPAIFRYSNGRERTVNTQATADGVIRISGVHDQWVLRIGDEVVCIQASPPAGVSS